MKRWIKYLLIVISVISAAACVMCGIYIWQYISGNIVSDNIRKNVISTDVITLEPNQIDQQVSDDSSEVIIPDITPEKTMSISIDFDALEEINNDIYAWIEIPGTVISYAVAQSEDDDLFYNKHGVDKSYYTCGSIFSQAYNTRTFEDSVTVLYGHNLKGGKMFSQLNNYADKEFFDNNNLIYIYTPEKVYEYEIFAACPYGSEHLLLNHDFNNEEQFNYFFENLLNYNKINANMREDLFPEFGDNVLALSTCYRQNRLQRYIVFGVLSESYTIVTTEG